MRNTTLDFNPCMKHQLIRKTVREFAESEIQPHVALLDKESRFPWEIVEKMKPMNFFGLQVPEEYGGAGLDTISFAIGGGFIEVQPDQVTVLADAAERAEEIDLERAEAARRRAEERLRSRTQENVDFARAEAALRRAMTRIKVTKLRRSRGGRQQWQDPLPPCRSLSKKS